MMDPNVVSAAKLEGAAAILKSHANTLTLHVGAITRDAVDFAITILEREAAAARIREAQHAEPCIVCGAPVLDGKGHDEGCAAQEGN